MAFFVLLDLVRQGTRRFLIKNLGNLFKSDTRGQKFRF